MSQSPITDVVGFFIFLSAIFFSAEVASIVGPYIMIAAAAVVGASLSLKRREKTTRLSAMLFFLRVAGLAVLVTGLIATVMSAQHPGISERAMLAPVALVVGVIGDDWGTVLGKVARMLFAAIDLVRGKGGTS